MNISAINFLSTHQISSLKSNDNYKTNNTNFINTINNDMFVSSNVSFGKKITKENLVDGLTTAGVIGAPFLLSLTMATALASNTNPEDIFLSDGTYLFNTNDLSLTSNRVHADADDGIFKVSGTGINLDPTTRNFDYVDVESGVYKNYDGSVDIDLLNNKYIDKENGIFIDPVSKISTIIDNGVEKHIPLPSFGTSMDPVAHYLPAPPPASSMDEIRDGLQNSEVYHCGTSNGCHFYIEQKDMDILSKVANNPDYQFATPTEEYKFERLINYLNQEGILENRYRNIDCIKDIISKNESVLEKIQHFFGNVPHVDNSTKYDLFGREIIPVGHGANATLTTLPDNPNAFELFKKFTANGTDAEDAVKIINDTVFTHYQHPDMELSEAIADGLEHGIPTDHIDMNLARQTLDKIAEDGAYYPDPGSKEAINFLRFQDEMMDTPIIPEEILLGDIIIDTESGSDDDGIFANIGKSFKSLLESMSID